MCIYIIHMHIIKRPLRFPQSCKTFQAQKSSWLMTIKTVLGAQDGFVLARFRLSSVSYLTAFKTHQLHRWERFLSE